MTPEGPGARRRASHADRQRAVETLATALRDARLDAAEHVARERAVEAAKYRDELADLTADLPDRYGVRDWADPLRVRAPDRQIAIAWLTEAFAEQRLDAGEYRRRADAVPAAATYRDLRPLLDGVPGPAGNDRDSLLVSAGDREAALARLARSYADGLVTEREHAHLAAAVRRAGRYRDLDALVLAPQERVSPQERARAVRRLDAARDDGRLDAVEYETRLRDARAATRDAQLAGLLADLPEIRPRRADRDRLSESDRQWAAQELQQALAEGKLDLDEYDARVRAGYAARIFAELRPVLADLIEGDLAPPASTRTGRPARPGTPARPDASASPEAAAGAGTRAGTGTQAGTGAARPVARRPLPGILPPPGDPGEADPPRWTATLGAAPEPPRWAVTTGTRPDREPRPPRRGMAPRTADTRWSVTRRGDAAGVGSWVTGTAVVQVRADGVAAYRLRDGAVAWTYQIPAGAAVVTMSRAVRRGIGLLGYRRAAAPALTVVALDLDTGAPVWEHHRPDPLPAPVPGDELAVAGDSAVVLEAAGYHALGLLDGAAWWRAPVTPGRHPHAVAAARDRVVLLETALPEPGAAHPDAVGVRTVDAGTGREWSRVTVRPGAGAATVVVSTDPLVLWTVGAGRVGAAVAFTPAGGWRSSVPRYQDDVEIVPGGGAGAARTMAVARDALFAPVRSGIRAEPTHLAAYALADGGRRWLVDLGDEVAAVDAVADRVVVQTTAHVISVAPGDGAVLETVWLHEVADALAPGTDGHDFWVVGDGYVVVNHHPGVGRPAVTAFA